MKSSCSSSIARHFFGTGHHLSVISCMSGAAVSEASTRRRRDAPSAQRARPSLEPAHIPRAVPVFLERGHVARWISSTAAFRFENSIVCGRRAECAVFCRAVRHRLTGKVAHGPRGHVPGQRTFQLLTQVAGRAGRGERTGEAIVQTLYPEHYSIQLACRQDYPGFFEREVVYRRGMRYPPFFALINGVVRGRTFDEAMQQAREIVRRSSRRQGRNVHHSRACAGAARTSARRASRAIFPEGFAPRGHAPRADAGGGRDAGDPPAIDDRCRSAECVVSRVRCDGPGRIAERPTYVERVRERVGSLEAARLMPADQRGRLNRRGREAEDEHQQGERGKPQAARVERHYPRQSRADDAGRTPAASRR